MIDHQELREAEVVVERQEKYPSGKQAEETIHWISETYKPGISSLLQQPKGLTRDIELADLSAKLAIALYPISRELDTAKKYDKRLTEALEEMRTELVGPISILTIADLILGCRPELKERLTSLEGIVAQGKVDVKSKVDLIFNFGTRDEKGREILHLAQLKGIREDDVRIARIHPEDKRDYLGEVSWEDAEKILQYAEWLRYEKKDSVVRSYVILVPAHDAEAVNNIYGIIRKDRRNLLSAFNQEATREGFLPPKKEK